MNAAALSVPLVGPIHAVWSDASAGDLRPAGRGDRGQALLAWALTAIGGEMAGESGGEEVRHVRWMEQVHGSKVLVAGVAGGAGGHPVERGAPVACAGPGDALASSAPELALAVLTADCPSIALGSAEGVFAAVHAGWRGLRAGVVSRTVRTMRTMGATEVVGSVGPCIHAECYAFSEEDLAAVVAVCGPGARGRTSDGAAALDLAAAVSSALAASDVSEVTGRPACTACEPGYFSHRARADRGRQALVVWSREARSV